jgi:hypothetical protein
LLISYASRIPLRVSYPSSIGASTGDDVAAVVYNDVAAVVYKQQHRCIDWRQGQATCSSVSVIAERLRQATLATGNKLRARVSVRTMKRMRGNGYMKMRATTCRKGLGFRV